MKKNLLAALAIALAIGAAAFTAKKPSTAQKSINFTNFYYRFDGTSGEEGMLSKWTQISKGAYDSLICAGSTKGCKITNTTDSLGHPTSVPLSGGLPAQTLPNVEVENQP